ncbi:protein MEI2-like 6 [Argentina anserina]|uniref:protein MEI2-like 6 n=1 Tax=Argentina anserina TaxID=57926 RepID=UPI00217684F7|nr:protein MEI2-like 6 [Potentilla anserina]
MEAAAMDQNPRVVVPRRKTKNFRRGRNVGPRLRSSRTSLAGNLAEGSRTATRVWEPESEASNFGSTGNWGGTVAPSSSRSGGKNSMGRRKVGLRLSPGPSHGIQAPSFPNGKGSLIPLPQSPDEQNGSEVTTLMIKNIPWNLRRGDLLLILKEHCQEENKKAGSLLKSEFNFFYLPLDFEKFWKRKRISNLGYAFVNFTTAVGAQRFYEKYHMFMWKEIIQSTKVCEISCAKIQGFKALEKWFRGKLYRGLRNDFLPVILAPACDGVRESNHIPVGHLL